jgi:hypothetical protein
MKHGMVKIMMLALSFLTINATAQENKDRGNTDYTNREKGKSKNTVNTDQKTPVKIIEYIPGTWKIESIYKGEKNITQADTVAMYKTIEFNREGRYVGYSGNEKIDSGAYRINEQHASLYLANESNDKPIEWSVSFAKNGNMTLRMKDESKHAESFRYIYKRDGSATSSNR